MDYTPGNINELMKNNHFNFKKMFGQNFIMDTNIISSIVEKAEIDETTLVIEIGPGAGALTTKLSQKAKQVLCYEIDNTLKPILDVVLENYDNISILYQDFLKSNILNDIQRFSYQKLYVIANLPYYITTPILMKLIEDKVPVDKIVIMVQKEVGNRFRAKPGTKEYNSLSIFLQYHFKIKKLIDVSRNVFVPKPNVDSIVISFDRLTSKLYLKDETLFFQLVQDSFQQKRKTLRNNLKKYDLIKIEEILKQYHYDLNVRAEALPIDVFVEIANHLSICVSNTKK